MASHWRILDGGDHFLPRDDRRRAKRCVHAVREQLLAADRLSGQRRTRARGVDERDCGPLSDLSTRRFGSSERADRQDGFETIEHRCIAFFRI
jgi:IS5 family transposase